MTPPRLLSPRRKRPSPRKSRMAQSHECKCSCVLVVLQHVITGAVCVFHRQSTRTVHNRNHVSFTFALVDMASRLLGASLSPCTPVTLCRVSNSLRVMHSPSPSDILTLVGFCSSHHLGSVRATALCRSICPRVLWISRLPQRYSHSSVPLLEDDLRYPSAAPWLPFANVPQMQFHCVPSTTMHT